MEDSNKELKVKLISLVCIVDIRFKITIIIIILCDLLNVFDQSTIVVYFIVELIKKMVIE